MQLPPGVGVQAEMMPTGAVNRHGCVLCTDSAHTAAVTTYLATSGAVNGAGLASSPSGGGTAAMTPPGPRQAQSRCQHTPHGTRMAGPKVRLGWDVRPARHSPVAILRMSQ